MSLNDVLKENIGATCYQTTHFLQDLVTKGKLTAYHIKTTSTQRKLRIVKTDKIENNKPLVIEYTPTKAVYQIDISSHGGTLDGDGSQTTHNSCYIEKLSDKVKRTEMIRDDGKHYHGRVRFPQQFVTATLRMSYSEDRDGSGSVDIPTGASAQTIIEGESDELFKKICNFFRQS
jgi:hypothetical protein